MMGALWELTRISETSFIQVITTQHTEVNLKQITKLIDGEACADIYFLVKPALLAITSITCSLLLLYCSCATVTRYSGFTPDHVNSTEVYNAFHSKNTQKQILFTAVSVPYEQ